MGGDIRLESSAGKGTSAHFTIPFKKPQRGQYKLEIDALPERLQSDMSVSCKLPSNDDTGTLTPPEPHFETSAPEIESNGSLLRHLGQSSGVVSREMLAVPAERRKRHVLVVEDSMPHPHSVRLENRVHDFSLSQTK
jgi:hypothetical protein